MATITVLNTNDSGAGSLRAAIAGAASGDTINFQAGVSGTITLTSGELLINKSLTISGPGAGVISVSGNNASRVFHVEDAGANAPDTVAISGLTITGGLTADPSGQGGGLYIVGENITLDRVNIVGNSAWGNGADGGGGVYFNGAAVGGEAPSSFTLTNSAVSGNTALNAGRGGGVFILNSQASAPATLQNDTITGNVALGAAGGGVMASGSTLSILNSTIVGNTSINSLSGGGIRIQTSALTLTDSIIFGNVANASSSLGRVGSTVVESYNLSNSQGGLGTGVGDIVGVDPLLGPLADHGGGVPTMLLSANSAAIDAGDPGFTGLSLDERGLARVSGGRVDIGAVEFQAAVAAPPTGGSNPNGTPTGPPPPPTGAQLEGNAGSILGVSVNSPKGADPVVVLADGSTVPNPVYVADQKVIAIEAQYKAGVLTYSQAVDAVVDLSGPTTGAVSEAYKFFQGVFPTAGGIQYMVDSPDNAHDLTDPAYTALTEPQRFMNLSVGLALNGPYTALFAQTYGALSFDAAVRQAYEAVVGTGYAIVAGIDINKAIAYLDSQQAYFTQVGGGDLGAKAAMIGFLMSSAYDLHVGSLYNSTHSFLEGQIGLSDTVRLVGAAMQADSSAITA